MPVTLLVFLLVALFLRLCSVAASKFNERRLFSAGAIEYGSRNSVGLALAHTLFYVAALIEGWFRNWPCDLLFWIGATLYSFGAVWVVIALLLLGRYWTVKLILAPDHVLITHPVYRTIRHPNYFLGLIPELVGYAVAFHAWIVMMAGLLAYAAPLARRIHQEEEVMRRRFPDYV